MAANLSSRSLRVLILNYEYPPLGGGAGVATRYLLSALDRQGGLHVDLVTSSLRHTRIEWPYPRTRIHYLDIGKKGSVHYQTQLNLLTYATRAFFYARKLLRETPYDIVHAFFGIPCGAVARQLNLPYIVSLRGSDVPFYNERFKTWDTLLFKRMSRSVWRDADKVVANSEGLKSLARASAPNQPIEVVYNGVDTEFFKPDEARRPGDTLIVVSTGRLIERKGYHHLIEALGGIDGVTLQLIGDGTRQAALEKLAHRHRVDVRFLGVQPREKVARCLRHADLFVLPSLNEGMSNALLEALAAGLPVVVTDVGGSSELVENNGIIVEKGNKRALRDAVLLYKNNPDLLREHGAASRKRAQSMSVDAMASAYAAMYDEAARRR